MSSACGIPIVVQCDVLKQFQRGKQMYWEQLNADMHACEWSRLFKIRESVYFCVSSYIIEMMQLFVCSEL